jgi:predicted dehydrogenase
MTSADGGVPNPDWLAPGVLRIGILGAGRVSPYALILPAMQTPGVAVEAVAARQLARAQAFASRHAIAKAYGSYDELLGDSGIDAVHVALPTALHAKWVQRAIDAGKHVLCEKPLASNAAEAERLVSAARRRNVVLQEGMHIRYLTRLHRQREVVTGGALGPLREVRACFRARVPMAPDDFRLDFSLGGGSGLDLGVYAVNCARFVAGEEPIVTSVRCRAAGPQVDRWMRARLAFPGGATGEVECGFKGWYLPRISVSAACRDGWIKWSKEGLVYRVNGRTVREATVPDWTYQRQLDAFLRQTRREASDAVPADDAVATARVLDAMYEGAGLLPRGTASSSASFA